MRSPATDKWEKDELKRLNAAPWMVEQLKLNPGYTFWGPHEDYMGKEGDGWDSRVLLDTWSDFKFELDEYNECVNFYFEINRDAENCATCGGSGNHPDAQWISESFYSHSSPFKDKTLGELRAEQVMSRFGAPGNERKTVGYFPSEEILAKYGVEFRRFCDEMARFKAWNDRITEDELEALRKSSRLFNYGRDEAAITVEQVNLAQNQRGMMGHDGINRSILIEARCKRLGVPHLCPTCDGHGSTFTEPAGHLTVVFWMLHPRKGCSRGVEVQRVEQSELPAVYKYLRQAALRNDQRFSKIPRRRGEVRAANA
jgi:hypothetical protein